jgi:DEAD/DEAH box helicase domain-containing protein
VSKHLVVDVEIIRGPDEVEGWDHTEAMGVSCAAVYDVGAQTYTLYQEEDVLVLQNDLLKADRITGFNHWLFDYPVIWGMSKQTFLQQEVAKEIAPKTDDLLRRLWIAAGLNPSRFIPKTHGGFNLDAVSRAIGGPGKIGDGKLAPQWFKDGHWARVATYCMDDVRLTYLLMRHLDGQGTVTIKGQQLEASAWMREKI